MASIEEKEEEIATLQAIYGESIKVIEEGRKVAITLEPNPGCGEEENPMRVLLTLELIDQYPEEVPTVSVRALKGLTRGQSDPLGPLVTQRAAGILGQPMCYELCSYVVEWLQNDAQDPDGVAADAAAAAAARLSAPTKGHGTQLTREIYAEWKTKFDAEQESKRKEKVKGPSDGAKLTGRQIFEKTVDWDLFKEEEVDEDFGEDDEDDEVDEDASQSPTA